MHFDKKFLMNNFFKLERYRVSADKLSEDEEEENEATVKIQVPAKNIPKGFDRQYFAEYQPKNKKFRALAATSSGNGTVDALDRALRKLLVPIYPFLKDVRLIRYSVQNTSYKAGTSSEVEVFVLASNGEGKLYYSEMYSKSVIEASFLALANIYNRYFRDDYLARH